MGGATSKQPAAVQPVVIRGEPPSRNTTIEGLSISTSEGCRDCRLVFPQGSSAASVRMYREFGAIQKSECDRYKQDVIRVRSGQLAWDEFKSNLSRGLYYEERTPGFCSQLMADTTELGKVATLEALPSVVRYPRIRKIAEDGGFSAETKLFLLPNIPFQFSFNGQTITVSKLALYHPCPLRVENSQYDAVLSLNDPGDATRPAVILMIPIKGDVSPGISGTFFERIASAIPGILQPSQPTGQYDPIDVPTGSNWNLSLLLSGRGTSGGTAVNTGYFVWSALPDMEEYLEVDTAYLKRYAWRPRSNAGPTYIMLKDPVLISPYDLQTLTLLPVTPAERAIHAPLATSVVYNASQTGSDVVGCSTSRESFTDQTSPQCDPFALLPQKAQFTGATLMQTLLGLIIPIVIVIVVFWAVKAASGPGGEAVMRWAEGAGRWVAGVRAAGVVTTGSAIGRLPGAIGRTVRRPFTSSAERRGEEARTALTRRRPVTVSVRNPLREYRSSEALSRGRRLVPAPPAKRTFSKGNKVIINKAKHPKGYVTRGGKKQKGGARDQCLGTPKYKQVGEIVDVKLEDPQGLTVLVKCTSPTGETTVDWYDPDDLLPYEGPDGDVVVASPAPAPAGRLFRAGEAGDTGAGTGLGEMDDEPVPARVVKKRVIAPEPPDEEPGAGTGLSALDEEVEREFNLLAPPPSIRSAKARSDERKARIAKERAATAAAKPPAARIPTPAPALSPVTRGLSDYRSPLARRSATASASVPPSRPAAPAVPPHKRGLSTTAINLPAAPIRALEPYKSSRAADLAKLRIAAAKPIGRLTDLQRSQALIQQANRDRDVKEQEAKKFVDTLDLPKPPQFGRGRKRRQTHRYA